MLGKPGTDSTVIKAACHVHSDWSYDGTWSLRGIAEEFGRRGFRAVMITEHDRGFTESRRQDHRQACVTASTSQVFLLPGIEYSDARNFVHILVWGPVPFLGEGIPTGELLKAVKRMNGVAVMAHPSRQSAWRSFEPAWAEYLLGVEVWNRKTDGWFPSKPALRLAQNGRLPSFVGMDFHSRRQLFPLAMDLDVDGGLTEDSLLASLRAHRFQPLAFGRPVDQMIGGWTAVTLHSAERLRRTAAATLRALRLRRNRAKPARRV